MIRPMMVTVLLIALARVGAAQSIDPAKVREAIKLPGMSINYQFQFNISADPTAPEDPKAQIAALRKTLHGAPSDAAVYVKIGDIYDADPLKNDTQAQAAYRKAITLFRQQLARQPRNGSVMTQLGATLYDVGQYAEAEKLQREAVRVAPKDWHAWAELGKFVQNYALFVVIGNGKPFTFSFNDISDLPHAVEPLLRKKVTPHQIVVLQKAMAEAHQDFDRAVSLNPTSPEPYDARSSFFWLDRLVAQNRIRVAQGEEPNYTDFMSGEGMADIWKAADLVPADMAKQAAAAFTELMNLMLTASDQLDFSTPGGLDRMPLESRDRIHKVIEQLRKTSEDKDPRKVKIAASALTTFDMINGDMPHAEKMAKRTLALDPNSKSAWDALCGAYSSTENYQQFAIALQDRLKHEDTAYNRLMLAKCDEHLSQSALVSEQIQSALHRFPDDLLINLAAVDMLMKRPEAEALKQAGQALAHAQTLFAKMPEAEQKAQQTNMKLTRGVYLALTGQAPLAKTMIQSVLTADEDNKEAKEVMAILGDSP